jgi:hypothetical protein
LHFDRADSCLDRANRIMPVANHPSAAIRKHEFRGRGHRPAAPCALSSNSPRTNAASAFAARRMCASRVGSVSFLSPTSSPPGKTTVKDMYSEPFPCFNEAWAQAPGKTQPADLAGIYLVRASMRPGLKRPGRPGATCFNEARLKRPGRQLNNQNQHGAALLLFAVAGATKLPYEKVLAPVKKLLVL